MIWDWFTVSYRSVILAASGIVLLGGGSLAWVFLAGAGERAGASAAISRASTRLAEAGAIASTPAIEELRASAAAALGEARSLFDERQYGTARLAATRSEDLSKRALGAAQGDADSHSVRFNRLEGDVRVKRAGEFSWESAELKMRLRVGDQIKTSASASAQIVYFDGTVTTIQPGSLLEIRDLYEDPATKVRRVSEKLTWGEMLASVEKRNVTGSVHEVATEKATARAVEAGELRVAYDREKRTATFDVFQGRAEVASLDRKVSIEAGERVRSSADGKLSTKEVLPAAPRLIAPSDQRVFVHDDPDKQKTTLSWEKVPGAARYRFMISDKSLFTEVLHDDPRRVDTSVVIEAIPPGDYYWKVAAVSPAGVEGPFSRTRRFRVSTQKLRDRQDSTPPALELTEFVQTGAVVIINGRTEPGAMVWVDHEKIDVYEDGTFYAVVRLRKEGENVLIFLAQDTAGNTTQLSRRAYTDTF